jgi:hypothetical protein
LKSCGKYSFWQLPLLASTIPEAVVWSEGEKMKRALQQIEVGTLIPCSECARGAHWAKCLECDEMFVKHHGLCPKWNLEHEQHNTIDKEPEIRRR